MKRRTLNNRGGFTLIEILVAVTILAVTISSLYRVFGGTLYTIKTAEGYARATVLAERMMNEILYENESFAPETSNGGFEGNERFKWESEIEEYVAPIGRAEEDTIYNNQLGDIVTYKVSVKVAWMEGQKEQRLELATLKTVLEQGE